MFKLELTDSQKLVLFDLLFDIDQEVVEVRLDASQSKLISDLVVQMEPQIDETFASDYGKILDKAKLDVLAY